MSLTIYVKKGKPNYKEQRLITAIQKVLDKKIAENPSLANNFQPARTFEELQSLHLEYTAEDVQFTETKKGDTSSSDDKTDKAAETTFEDNDEFENEGFIDPMNREEPIVRDYVTNNEFPNDENAVQNQGEIKTEWGEPLSFKESFEMPNSDDNSDNKGDGNQNKTRGNGGEQRKPKPEPQQPLNPNFDEMNNGKKKRSTKKFAKYIVEAVSMLTEKGFVWYATKDINEGKLAEYELNGEMDLDLLITLEDGQVGPIRKFFQDSCKSAEELAKIDPEKLDDFIDALTEVLLEKGIGPTPAQECLLIGLTILGEKVVLLMQHKAMTGNVLNQLRILKADEAPAREVEKTTTREDRPQPPPQPPTPNTDFEDLKVEVELPKNVEKKIMDEGNFETIDEAVILDKPIETME